jgi:hypothetical protein
MWEVPLEGWKNRFVVFVRPNHTKPGAAKPRFLEAKIQTSRTGKQGD